MCNVDRLHPGGGRRPESGGGFSRTAEPVPDGGRRPASKRAAVAASAECPNLSLTERRMLRRAQFLTLDGGRRQWRERHRREGYAGRKDATALSPACDEKMMVTI